MVEQNSKFGKRTLKREGARNSIHSVANVVPTYYAIHKSISSFYSRTTRLDQRNRPFRAYVDRKYNHYWQHWRVGIEVWQSAHTGIPDFNPHSPML